MSPKGSSLEPIWRSKPALPGGEYAIEACIYLAYWQPCSQSVSYCWQVSSHCCSRARSPCALASHDQWHSLVLVDLHAWIHSLCRIRAWNLAELAACCSSALLRLSAASAWR